MKRLVFVLAALALSGAPSFGAAPNVVRGIAYVGCYSRTPLAKYSIRISNESESRTVQTNAKGAFAFVGLPDGEYRVTLVPQTIVSREPRPSVATPPFPGEGRTRARPAMFSARVLRLDGGETAKADLGFSGQIGYEPLCTPTTVANDPPTVDRYLLR